MNIHQAVAKKLDIETIVDSYYAIVLIPGTQTVYNPVDFRLNKGTISVPLKPEDIYFKYKIDKNNKDIHYATIVLDRYYPEGSTINIKGINMTISYYDSPFFKPCDNKYIALHCTVSVDDKSDINEVLMKDAHESAAKREIENILISNERLKHLLPYYSYNWLNYTSDYIDPYQNFTALKRLYEIFIAERSEYEYKINDLNYYLYDENDDETKVFTNAKKFRETYKKFLKQVNYEKMFLSYYSDVYILFNTISIAKWFLFNKNFDEDDNITIKGHYQHPCHITVSSNTSDVTISVVTPKCALYDYDIVCKNVTRCNVNNAYYDYTMSNLIVYAKNKSNSLKIELINLTGMDGTLYNSHTKYRIKPAYLNCEYAPYDCINGLPAWMINWWETTTRHIGEEHDSESDSSRIDYSSYSDTFFRFLCEVLRYICASEQIFEKFNKPECVQYYADLNANLIKLFAEFKLGLNPEELFVENEDEFYTRYRSLLDKRNEDITINDIVSYASARQELDYITTLKGENGSNNISKFVKPYKIKTLNDTNNTCRFSNYLYNVNDITLDKMDTLSDGDVFSISGDNREMHIFNHTIESVNTVHLEEPYTDYSYAVLDQNEIEKLIGLRRNGVTIDIKAINGENQSDCIILDIGSNKVIAFDHSLCDPGSMVNILIDISFYFTENQYYQIDTNHTLFTFPITMYNNIYNPYEIKEPTEEETKIFDKYHDGDKINAVNSTDCVKTIFDFGDYGANLVSIKLYGSDGHSDEIVAVAGDKVNDTFEDDYDKSITYTKVLRTNGNIQNDIPVIANEWNEDSHYYAVQYLGDCRYVILYRSAANTPSNVSEIEFEGYLNSKYRARLDEIREILNNLFNLDGECMVVDVLSDIEIIDTENVLDGTILKVLNDGTNHFRYFKYDAVNKIWNPINYIYLKGDGNDIDHIDDSFIIPDTCIDTGI